MVGGDRNGFFFFDGYSYDPSKIDVTVRETSATTFSTNINGQLIIDSGLDAGDYAVEDEGEDTGDPYLVYASNTGDLTTANEAAISCSLIQNTDGTCPLSCVSEDGGSISYECGVYWRLGPSLPTDPFLGCNAFTPYAVGGI